MTVLEQARLAYRIVDDEVTSRYRRAPCAAHRLVFEVGGVQLRIDPRSQGVWRNHICGLGTRVPASETLLDEVLAAAWDSRAQFISIALPPETDPPELPDWLVARGFQGKPKLGVLLADCSDPPPDGPVEVVEVTAERLDDWLAVYARVLGGGEPDLTCTRLTFGQPGQTFLLAMVDGQPAATGRLYLRDGVALLQDGGTLREFRCRGCQSSLIARRLQLAAAAGCHTAVCEVIAPLPGRPKGSYRNLLRAGFKLAFIEQGWWRERPKRR